MRINLIWEFYGNCAKAIEYYDALFGLKVNRIQTYGDVMKELACLLTEDGKDMISCAEIELNMGENKITIEMSDILTVAMGIEEKLAHNPWHLEYSIVGDGNHDFGILPDVDEFGVKWNHYSFEENFFMYCIHVVGNIKERVLVYRDLFDVCEVDEKTYVVKLSKGVGLRISEDDNFNTYNAKLHIVFSNAEEAENVFEVLKKTGKANRELDKMRKGNSGSLVDENGLCWDFYLE